MIRVSLDSVRPETGTRGRQIRTLGLRREDSPNPAIEGYQSAIVCYYFNIPVYFIVIGPIEKT
jgi:hypothetical protein